jgi:hypothetical protein
MKRVGLLAGAALVVAACAGNRAPEPLTISEVSVETDLSAVQSRQAVAFWQGLSGDLETALASEFAGQIDPAGKRILVDIDELSLTSAFAGDVTSENAVLSGMVTLQNPNETVDSAYNVTATQSDVASYLSTDGGAVTVSPTSDAYYRAVVQAFARGTAEVLNNPPES